MTRDDLARELANKSAVSIAAARVQVDTMLDIILKSLLSGESVLLREFGVFSRVDVPARDGRNPATGEAITIPAKRVIKFKASKSVMETLKAGAKVS